MRSTMLFLHLLGVVTWIGGMLFAVLCFRPSLALIQPPERARLLAAVLRRFFNLVIVALALIWISGPWLWARIPAQAVPLGWHLMLGFAVVMTAIFAWLRVVLLGRVDRALKAGEAALVQSTLAGIHRLVLTNLALGLLAIAAVRFV